MAPERGLKSGVTPARGSKSALAWLTARPIAHRGLHDPAQGIIENKSRFDGDLRLATRTAAVLAGYPGPVAVISFDPAPIAELRRIAPRIVRGIVAGRGHPPHVWKSLDPAQRFELTFLLHAPMSRPAFLAHRVDDLAAITPRAARLLFGLPLLAWTVRTAQDRTMAARFADQAIFEGYRA